jgi:hypothetical protein
VEARLIRRIKIGLQLFVLAQVSLRERALEIAVAFAK